MQATNNYNIVEIPDNDTNHCKYCRERLGKRYIISSSMFYCNIDCLRGYMAFKREIIKDKEVKIVTIYSIIIIGLSALIFLMILAY